MTLPSDREPASSDGFYATIPVFTGFADVTNPDLFMPVPDDWVLGIADVVSSTEAIGAGRYKAVNTAGAAVISAVSNALGRRAYPFVFGGDGAILAVSAADATAAGEAIAATAAWATRELGLDMRAATVTVAAVREAGLDVRVARFAPSPDVSYAMFSGGGVSWAEELMKDGTIPLLPPPGRDPDLTGLSCRFEEVRTRRGVILSVIARPRSAEDIDAFRAAVGHIMSLADDPDAAGSPLHEEVLRVRWPRAGIRYEAAALARGGLPRPLRLALAALRGLATFLIFRWGIRIGGFRPVRYASELIANADFRKYGDGLMLTLDCTPLLATRLEEELERYAASGSMVYGITRQEAALVTCLSPSPTLSDHVHFVDGSAGGYAAAAARMKRTVATGPSVEGAVSVP